MNKEYIFEDIDRMGWGRWFKYVSYICYNDKNVIKFLELFDNLSLKTKYEYIGNYQLYISKINELYNKLMNDEYIDKKIIKLTYDYFKIYTQQKLNINKYDF